MSDGPDLIDFTEWATFYYDILDTIKKLKEPAKSDVEKLLKNTQESWLIYSMRTLNAKKHNETLYQDYCTMKKTTEKYITMAILRGMYKD